MYIRLEAPKLIRSDVRHATCDGALDFLVTQKKPNTKEWHQTENLTLKTENLTLKSDINTKQLLQFLHLHLNCQSLLSGFGCESSANSKSLFPSLLFEDTLHSSLEDSAHKIGECSNYDERGDVLVSRTQPKLHSKYLKLPQSKKFKSPLTHIFDKMLKTPNI